jgi:glycine oxidase
MRDMYEVVVAGAGVIGSAIAWRAAAAGLSVLVVDSDEVSRGASTVAAGMLAPITEATFGEEGLLALNLRSAESYAGFVEEVEAASGVDVGFQTRGTLHVAVDRDQKDALERLFDFQRSLDLPSEWLNADACRTLEPALHPSVIGGVLASSDKSVNPRALTPALSKAAMGSGAEEFRGVPVSSFEVTDGKVVSVQVGNKDIRCGWLVVAAGCWSGSIRGIAPWITAALRPVKGQIVRLNQRGRSVPVFDRVIRTEDVYLVPRRDGEVVVGATVEEQGFDTDVTAGAVFDLLRAADEVVPSIRELELAEVSAGLRPGSADNAPLIGGCDIEGLLFATGHFRNGILLAPVTADAIVEMIDKKRAPDYIQPFSPMRFEP